MRAFPREESVENIQRLLGAILACVAFYALLLLPKLMTISALLFIGAGMAYAVIAREKLIPAFLSAALVMLLPLIAVASTIWSVAPGDTFRASVQYTITVAVMIVFFRTLPVRLLVGALMAAGAAASVTVLALQPDALLHQTTLVAGLGSKNVVAFNSSVTFLAALGVLFDKLQPKPLRIVAAATVPLSALTLILAQSAGGLVATIIGVAVLIALVWFKHLPSALRGGAVVLLLAIIPLAWFVGPTMANALFADMLEATGKDPTLTGRTELWNFALSRIPDHPIIGMGYQAFWIQGTPDAEALWRTGNVAARSGFNFHNQYLELMIELGAIGTLAFVITALSGFIGILHKALVSSNSSLNCLVVILLSLLTRSSIESVMAIPFSTFTALFMAACCVGITPLVESRMRLRPAAPARSPKLRRQRGRVASFPGKPV